MALTEDARGVYEIRVRACADAQEALGLQEPIGRLLCPEPGHAHPCEVPWSFTLDDEEGGGTAAVLVVGVYASRGQAARVAEQVRALVGERRPVVLRDGDEELFEDLVDQYRIESALRGN